MCKSHYTTDYKKRRYLAHASTLRHESVGAERRLRALVAIGWSQRHLAEATGVDQSRISRLLENPRRWVNHQTHLIVCEVYDRLSMTVGPSEAARRRAAELGWPPPLAWDDEDLDDISAAPDVGQDNGRLPFAERFAELRELGYTDLEICGRMEIQPESLLRQLWRHDIKPDAELVNAATSAKWERRSDSGGAA